MHFLEATDPMFGLTSLPFVVQSVDAAIALNARDSFRSAHGSAGTRQIELLADRTAQNYERMRSNGVSIDEPASPAVIAALKRAASGPIAAWQAKVLPEAVAILDWASRQ